MVSFEPVLLHRFQFVAAALRLLAEMKLTSSSQAHPVGEATAYGKLV